jgi:hypothetical protein
MSIILPGSLLFLFVVRLFHYLLRLVCISSCHVFSSVRVLSIVTPKGPRTRVTNALCIAVAVLYAVVVLVRMVGVGAAG